MDSTVALPVWQVALAVLGLPVIPVLVQHVLQRPDRLWKEVRDLWAYVDRLERKIQRYRGGYYRLVDRYIGMQRKVIQDVVRN